MTTIFRRIAAGSVLAIAPAIIALGTATAGHADTGFDSHSPNKVAPAPHQVHPGQDFSNDAPGSRSHHHHQWHHGW